MTGRCMIVDISRCVGCQTCVVSCKAAAGTGPGIIPLRDANSVRSF